MKWFPIICYLGIGAWQVTAHWEAIRPRDPAEREALHLCFMANHQFDPLEPAARERCFREVIPASQNRVETARFAPPPPHQIGR